MNERALCAIWNALRFDRSALHDSAGNAVEIVYRGRWQRGPGPDFRGAMLSIANGPLRHGDVELHLRTADWYAHRHHLDPAFNGVILHVVLAAGGAAPVTLLAGGEAPTLALQEFLAGGEDELASEEIWRDEPCRPGGDELPEQARRRLRAALATAGEERLREHAVAIEGDLCSLPLDELLYTRLLDALGYSQNRRPFRTLASLLPLAALAEHSRGCPSTEEAAGRLAQVLLAAAGFGEAADRATQQRLAWRLAGLRPANRPEHRLRGLANLLASCACRPSALLDLPWREGRAARVNRQLRGRLQTGAGADEREASYLGAGRAAEIVVNLLLPLLLARASNGGDEAGVARALALYAAHPRLPENQTTTLMGQLLDPSGELRLLRGARAQQGAQHLFNRYCDFRRCDICPAARAHEA